MSELVEFIRGCLDADEQTARAVSEPLVSDDPFSIRFDSWESDHSQVDSAFVDRFDPARVLAEVNAKRAILDLHGFYFEVGRQECECCGGEPWPCETIRALAQPFRGEPGWRDEWGTQ